MTIAQIGSAKLCTFAHDLVDVVQRYQHKQHGHTTLQMHNTRMGEWDEICVMAVDADTSTEKLVVKISLARLTQVERAQLKLQVGLYNKTLLSS
ncbi:MAG: Unknown protein [uncultured Thiotrichaceae bacterium]|uniref:Uncharacterized protein n=1 Tax=uncultured Thiotrichaceae bacterium TaxID=298394 RepID=A0A6S6SLN8_9GAMM|nr:MAG: Unknown protein [uncultured Thiotrichaceae bacterium]